MNIDKLNPTYMHFATEIAKLSSCKRAKNGAVITNGTRIISMGYNGTCSGMDNNCEDENGVTFPWVLHAEANAIMKLAYDGECSKDSTLFCTTSPCIDCSKLIIQAGIQRVYYKREYRLLDGLSLLESQGIDCIRMDDEHD